MHAKPCLSGLQSNETTGWVEIILAFNSSTDPGTPFNKPLASLTVRCAGYLYL